MEKLHFPLPVTEAVLNHVSGSKGGIVGIYQRREYTDEKREALDKWAGHVEKLINNKVTGRAPAAEFAQERGRQPGALDTGSLFAKTEGFTLDHTKSSRGAPRILANC